ncbi:sugar-binding protein [Maribacter algarum]|uniref:Sugar-binding protein n=1 Tax=Maribacter algarum (ex Zhang et al. 2020) TaxID=2578118 RepID=A0A5S3PGP2_9FLAO|nr:sugar-binding protein [Maribacter algarum]TMM53310.1 sugar-binding protein [Maribacter algarum]
MKLIVPPLLLLFFYSCHPKPHYKEDHQIIEVKRATKSPIIDGKGNENSWNVTEWHPLDQNWLGPSYDYNDFNGRYKLNWDEDYLYLLVEIIDDSLYDRVKDPLKLWWNDDSLQVFIDEDNSGGLHQKSHNAFGYHIALDGNVVDLSESKAPKLFNEHILSAKTQHGNQTTWEMAITLYDDSYSEKSKNQTTVLETNKKIGFALAYCDNDGSIERENYIGSVFVPGEDKNQAWVNADIFGTLVLK